MRATPKTENGKRQSPNFLEGNERMTEYEKSRARDFDQKGEEQRQAWEERECPACKIKWDMIRRNEDELYKMKKHPKVYGKTIAMLEKELKPLYASVRECRQRNHPEEMY